MFHVGDAIRRPGDSGLPDFDTIKTPRAGLFYDVLLNTAVRIPENMVKPLIKLATLLQIPFKLVLDNEPDEQKRDQLAAFCGSSGARLGPLALQTRGDRARLLIHYLVSHKQEADADIVAAGLPPFYESLLMRCMTRVEAQHWIRAPRLHDIHCICNHDYVAPLEKSSTVSFVLSKVQHRAAAFFFHKWRCIDLGVPYELWLPTLQLLRCWFYADPDDQLDDDDDDDDKDKDKDEDEDMPSANASEPLMRHIFQHYRNIPGAEECLRQHKDLLERLANEATKFARALKLLSRHMIPNTQDDIYCWFIWDLMHFIQSIGHEHEDHLAAPVKTHKRWLDSKPISVYEAISTMVQHLRFVQADAAHKCLAKPEEEKFPERHQLAARIIQGLPSHGDEHTMWDPWRREWAKLELIRREGRDTRIFSRYIELAQDATSVSFFKFYWFAPHVCNLLGPNHAWHHWRCLVTGQSIANNFRRREAYSGKVLKWCQDRLAKSGGCFTKEDLPVYELMLAGPKRVDWDNTDPVVLQAFPRLGRSFAELRDGGVPEKVLYYIVERIRLKQFEVRPPAIEPEILQADPRLFSVPDPQAHKDPARSKVSRGWFELLMVLEYRARRIPSLTYNQPIGLTHEKWQSSSLDTPLVFDWQQGTWYGLSYPQNRVLSTISVSESNKFSSSFSTFLSRSF
jgi:hypothetical protein